MAAILFNLIPVFALIALGWAIARLKLFSESFWPELEKLTYYILFPALLIHRLANANFESLSLSDAAIPVITALAVTSLATFIWQFLFKTDAADFTSVYQGAIRFNTYLALASVNALTGDEGLIIAAVVIAILIPMINLLCVSVFQLMLHRQSSNPYWKTLATNPLILGCLIGIGLNFSQFELPLVVMEWLGMLGKTALPLGLIAVGVGIKVRQMGHHWLLLISASAFKFIAMPLGFLLGAILLNANSLITEVLIIIAAQPTASSAYILARQLGGNTTLMANIISSQTLLAVLSIPLWLIIFQRLV
jgi:malonate transporter